MRSSRPNLTTMEVGALGSMTRLAAMLFAWALALGCAQANAQAGATPPTAEHSEGPQSAEPNASQTSLAHPPTADDICRALEQAAAENALPVEFFARVIWQESRFNASAVSPKGAEGIAQFVPRTADWHGLANPFDPIEPLRHSAGYLRELRDRFGNLGLAAAAKACLREAGQSDLGAEAGGAADRHLRTALGRATRCPFIREQSVGNLPRETKALRFVDR